MKKKTKTTEKKEIKEENIEEVSAEVTEADTTPAKAEDKRLKWYIINSSSGKENKTALLIKQRVKANDLEDMVTEVLVPTQEKIIIKRGKKEKIEERILPGYVLIRMVLTDETMHIIRNTEGVIGFLGASALSKYPTALSNKEADALVTFTKIQQQPIFSTKFAVSDAVKVIEGPFKDFVGTVQDVNESKGQVTVLLSIFDRETPVQLDFLQVSKI
jgi:transcription termination/antitermination protein NusG